MSTIQKYLMGLVGLGALYLVVSNPKGIAAAGAAFKNITGGAVTQITTGGRRG
jgi:hypothetical protein